MRWGPLVVMVAVAGLSSGPSFAQSTPAQSTQATANSKDKNAADPNEIVCEKHKVLGSRLATQRICHTRAEWADLRSQDRQEIERAQMRRGMQDQ